MKQRGREHTTLTETSQQVVYVLKQLSGIKMIAPGEIRQRRANSRHITIIRTRAGFELLISGQGVQKVAVHTDSEEVTRECIKLLQTDKNLKNFAVSVRERLPGV
jgi:hypothetical protein